ncbi:MAG TPA: hypothetical protein VGK30_13680 [Candidatus Binatia bacterium]|jgi:hypothetical protein
MDRVSFGPLLLMAMLLVLPAGGGVEAGEPVAVTGCGQEYAGTGYLTADLDCSAVDGPAVVITGKGSLDLQGFTVAGNANAITCLQSCSIMGPGQVSAANGSGINAAGALDVTHVDVVGSSGDGIVGYHAVRVLDSMIAGNGSAGVRSQRVVIRGSMITANGSFGALSGDNRRVVLRDSQVIGNGLSDDCAQGAACADVASGRKPRLRHSTCDTSWNSRSPDGADWSICLED